MTNLKIIAPSLTGIALSNTTPLVMDDINQIIQILVQVVIGLVTVYRILKKKNNDKKDKTN